MTRKVFRSFTSLFLAFAFAMAEFSPGLAAPPSNDNFADAELITSLPFSATVDIADATNEGEPGSCYYYMERTVWYSYTPTETSGVSVSTLGSANNRNVNIYRSTGPDISDLIFLDCAIENESSTFVAEFGKTYHLQVGSVFNEVGTIQLNLEPIPSPANDDFINAVSIPSPLPFDHFVDLSAASSQDDEPVPSCASFGLNGTVWYAFTPAASGSILASINGEEYTILAAYTGSSFNDLTEVGCNAPFGGAVSLPAEGGTTYYFQAGNFVSTQSGSMQFRLEVTPPPVANFYFYPGDPSRFDTVQFCSSSYDPGNVGIESFTWDFGDGATATEGCATHRYTADGDYTVQHTVTTFDGRTAAATPQTVQVRTHDVAITKITAPNSANSGQTKSITVTLRNTAYSETVQLDLYKSVPGGFVWVATLTKSVPALSGNRTTSFNFNYMFTSDDARIGKVTFKAVATLIGASDALPIDNEAISSPPTKVSR